MTSFLLKFKESPEITTDTEMAKTQTFTKTREEPDQDEGYHQSLSLFSGTMTSTATREEKDQDESSGPMLGTLTRTDSREETDQDKNDLENYSTLYTATQTRTRTREESDQDNENSFYLRSI